MNNEKLIDIIKQFVEALITEASDGKPINQAITNIVRKLVGNFKSVDFTIKVERSGMVSIWFHAEIV